jgi:hypothetical protein
MAQRLLQPGIAVDRVVGFRGHRGNHPGAR